MNGHLRRQPDSLKRYRQTKGMPMRIIERHFPTPADPIAREGAGLANFQPGRQAGPWLFGTVRAVDSSKELLLLHQPEERNHQIVHWLPQTRFAHHGAKGIHYHDARAGRRDFLDNFLQYRV